ncbi:MAG: DUF2169 domain-containing protein [Candidatus Eisenbacteria bacterium]|nr:DUF2169 domain-containing protein [Candidatus Eisenbacteria bacterium]
MELDNRTAMPAQIAVLPDKDGYETLLVIAKATYRLVGERLEPHDEPVAITQADEFHGKPGESSVRLESDLALGKPATDVVVLGHAYAPKGKAKEGKLVLRVGKVEQSARVFGDRRFALTLGLVRISGPEPFEKLPLLWERSFGGVQTEKGGKQITGGEERNPVGTGFVKKKRRSFIDGLALPNFEHPKMLLKRPGQRPTPVGFGFVGRHWVPRRNYMGTYDAAWERDRLPLVPVDFDLRAFCAAPEAMQFTPHLVGGEPILLDGFHPRGPLRFALPTGRPRMAVEAKGSWTDLEPTLDTVVIEPDEGRVALTYRASFRIHNFVRRVSAIRVEASS